jgi:hypothetical protein
MSRSSGCLRAAFSLLALALGAGGAAGASAQGQAIDVPSYRRLEAAEPMAAAGLGGVDYSANAPALAGLTLLATIPAPSAPRRGYLIQAQCTAGVTVALDDPDGASTPTLLVLAGAAAEGGQGGTLDMAGIPHTGRIRIYSSAPDCQMAARSW